MASPCRPATAPAHGRLHLGEPSRAACFPQQRATITPPHHWRAELLPTPKAALAVRGGGPADDEKPSPSTVVEARCASRCTYSVSTSRLRLACNDRASPELAPPTIATGRSYASCSASSAAMALGPGESPSTASIRRILRPSSTSSCSWQPWCRLQPALVLLRRPVSSGAECDPR